MAGPRRTALFLVLVALAATVVLALALPGLRLAPGLPLPTVTRGAFVPTGEAPVTRSMPVHWAALLVLLAGAAALVLVALWRALRGVRLRSLGRPLVNGAFLLGAVCLGILLLGLLASPGAPRELDLHPPPVLPEVRTPLGRPPPLVLWITAAALVLASTVAAAWLLRPRRALPDPLLERLGLEAGRARAALAAGQDGREIILSCYARMSAALEEGRGVERPASMTAHEFCERLVETGLPRSPVRELTALFEAVRYGRWAPTPADESRALACLDPIVEACRGPREGAR